MITVGNIQLNRELELIDNESKVLASSVVNTFGRPVVQTINSYGGNEIFLEAKLEGNTILGYFTHYEYIQLRDLRDAGIPVLLQHYGKFYNVFLPGDAISGLYQHNTIVNPDSCPDSIEYVGRLKMIII